jgi:hypothetical protein
MTRLEFALIALTAALAMPPPALADPIVSIYD